MEIPWKIDFFFKLALSIYKYGRKELTMAARGDPYMSTLRQAHIIPITMILKSNSLMANVVATNTTPKPPMSNLPASPS